MWRKLNFPDESVTLSLVKAKQYLFKPVYRGQYIVVCKYERFTAGDFDLPMFIHDRVPPGVPVMKAKRTAISYTYQENGHGGQVRIKTSDSEALNAIHEFLAFQIQDHRTGDPIKQ